MIERLIIHNFKGIKSADIPLNTYKNVIVGNNGAGKSTIMEALSLAMGYGLNKLEVTPHLFHIDCIKEFRETKTPPTITIEVIISGAKDEFSGTNNSLRTNLRGLQLKICFDEDYADLFEAEKDECTQIPCEYYKVERNWFSDAPVKQQLIPYNVMIVDSGSTYFNVSSNQYMTNLLKKYIGDDNLVKVQSSLRHLREKFEGEESINQINETLSGEIENLKVSIDVTSNIIFRNILCPFWDEIPIGQIGEGELCILKTLLSIDKSHLTDKPKVVIIEEPETHLSHTKMYELIRKIEENLKDDKTQLIVTTHNSFVANKLDLSNLMMISNDNGIINTCKPDKRDNELFNFFTKISNYPTLRLILCKSAILVEGPTDEMVITYYYKKKYDRHPFDDGIELISVEGVKFKNFAELAKSFKKRVAIVTDNDGFSIEDLHSHRGLDEIPDNIKIFTEIDTSIKTLEPSFVKANVDNLQELSNAVRKMEVNPDTEADLVEFMRKNKTEWAYRLLTNIDSTNFKTPEYIIEAINWIRYDGE